ncbi:MAG: cation:proton antiporter [Nanoarchaeota archaeon]
MEALTFLTYLAIVLLIGIISSIISQKLKLPNILLLLIAGLLVNYLPLETIQLLQFPPIFLTGIAILALVMIIFDSSARFKLKEFDSLSTQVFKLTGIFLLLNTFLLTASSMFIFNINSIFLALLFSFLMSGTDPGSVLTMFKGVKNRVVNLLEIESLLNTPLIVLLPFLVLDLMENLGLNNITSIQFFNQIFTFMPDFFLRFVAGVGSGVIIGLIVFRIMKKEYSETLSPLALITAALLTYILAENLGGNGVLAVTTLGLLFGNLYVREKGHLFEFSSIFATSLQILVFFLIGLSIKIPFTKQFLVKSSLLFVIYILIRLSTIHLSFYNNDYNFKEKLFMALNVQKGIAVAVVAFTLSTFDIKGIGVILDLTVAFMLYSILLSTIVGRYSHFFLNKNDKNRASRVIRTG